MGILPIGFFSPLPLAMMIPFMATQSLAMGEAFGKSFQYGKRKISAMSNEDFNKYTFADMMNEQTINYKMMIPKLHEQMEASQQMQQDIFTEMIKIIPAFMAAVIDSITSLDAYKQFNEPQDTPFGKVYPPGSSTLVSGTQLAPPAQLELTSHGDTITTPPPPTNELSSIGDRRIAFKSQYKNWTKYSLTQVQKIPGKFNKEEMLWLDDMIRNAPANTKSAFADIPIPQQAPLTTTETAQKSYLTLTINAQVKILEHKAIVADIDAELHFAVNSATSSSVTVNDANVRLRKAKSALANAEKALITIITHARNNSLTRSAANADWNNRIWKM